MRHTILLAGISVLAISGPALAQNSVSRNRASPTAPSTQLAQVQVQAPPGTVVTTPGSPPTQPPTVVTTPGSPPAISNPPSTTVVVTATKAPPPPQAENPPQPPGPTYVWTQGHWSWDGAQYAWTPGRYVVPPTTVARWTPGYWQQGPDGWVWIDGSWN